MAAPPPLNVNPNPTRSLRVVVLNPHAAGGRAARLARPIAGWLSQHMRGVPLHQPDSPAQARALLGGLPPGSHVVVVGGDGTFHQMLSTLHARRHSAALVPAGSGNDLARALGLHGLPWEQALRIALTEPPSRMDLGLARWRDLQGAQHATLFASSFTAGFDSAVVRRTLSGPRWLTGRPRYLWATARELLALRNWPVRVGARRVEADGSSVVVLAHDGPVLFASTLNTPTFGSGMPATPAAQIRDGMLDPLVAGPFGRLGTLVMLPRLLLGRHLGHPRVRTVQAHAIELHTLTSQGIPLAADGEYLAQASELQIEPLASALSLVQRPR